MNTKRIAVRVGRGDQSKTLRRILFSLVNGKTNGHDSPPHENENQDDRQNITLYFFNKKYDGWDYGDRYSDLTIDARTEIGKLIDLLEEKPEIRIENITNEGDHGIISEDKKRIKVGCREITREKVKEVYEAMFS